MKEWRREGLNRVLKVIPCQRLSCVQPSHLTQNILFVFGPLLQSWGDLGGVGHHSSPSDTLVLQPKPITGTEDFSLGRKQRCPISKVQCPNTYMPADELLGFGVGCYLQPCLPDSSSPFGRVGAMSAVETPQCIPGFAAGHYLPPWPPAELLPAHIRCRRSVWGIAALQRSFMSLQKEQVGLNFFFLAV